MPPREYVAVRFRPEGGDDPTGAEEPQWIEVTESRGFPVRQTNAPPEIESIPHFNGAASSTLVQVIGGTAFIDLIEASNISPADVFLQLFDTAGVITVGTTAPTNSFLIPKGDGTNRGAMDKPLPKALRFTHGISYAVTTTATGSTAPATAAVVNILYHQVQS